MPVKKKPSPAQLAARAKFVKMVRAKAAAKKKAAPKKVAAKKVVAKKMDSHKDNKCHNVNIRVLSGVKQSDINFGVYVKGKRILITKSPTTAINEAKFYSISFDSIAIIKSGNVIFAKYKNGKKI
jgi:hypothetical protein